MSRFARIAATLGLAVLTASPALAVKLSAFGMPLTLKTTCYTRYVTTLAFHIPGVNPTQTVARQCGAGEPPGSVTTIYI